MTPEQIEQGPRQCEPLYGSCALLSGHRGPHHGYPEDIEAIVAHRIAAMMPEATETVEYAIVDKDDVVQWGPHQDRAGWSLRGVVETFFPAGSHVACRAVTSYAPVVGEWEAVDE
jgi:hypothetical protein